MPTKQLDIQFIFIQVSISNIRYRINIITAECISCTFDTLTPTTKYDFLCPFLNIYMMYARAELSSELYFMQANIDLTNKT